MPIHFHWVNDEDKTLIYVKLEGKIGAAEILANDEVARAMLAEVDHPVDMILDYSHQIYFGPDYVETAEKLKMFQRENIRLVVWLGSELAWGLYEAFSREYGGFPIQAAYAGTIEEAYEQVGVMRRPPFAEWN